MKEHEKFRRIFTIVVEQYQEIVGLDALFPSEGTTIVMLCITEKIFILRCGKQTVIHRNKRIPIWPSQGLAYGILFYILLSSGQILLSKVPCFRTGMVEQTVIYDEYIFAVITCQRFYKIIDDSGRKQFGKPIPVCFYAVKKSINCIFREVFLKGTGFHLHIHTPVSKY